MAFPSAAKQAFEKLKQGPLDLVISPSSSPVSVFVNGGVEFTFVEGMEAAELDLLGTYDLFTTGDSVTFEITVPETSHNILKVIFASGVFKDTSTKYLGFGRAAGISARTTAQEFRFRPWQTRSLATLQLELWKVVPEGDAKKVMRKTEPWAWTRTFRALPDLTKANGELLGRLTLPERS